MDMNIEAGGRGLRLRYTFNSICAVEERAGMALDRLMGQKHMAVRLLFWGALIEEQPEITLREAGDILGAHLKAGGSLDGIAAMCAEALERAGFIGGEEKA